MSKLEPSFAIKPLQQVPPGSPVIYQRAVAFAGVNRTAPQAQQLVTLAVHDAQQGKFAYSYFNTNQPNVLVPTGEIIIRPKLDTLTENVMIQPASTRLFFADGEPFIVVQLPGVPDVRLLSLKDGAISAKTFQMDAFASWEIGVLSLGEFVPLLKI